MPNSPTRVNHQIKAPSLRVINFDGTNLGVLPLPEALSRAKAEDLDLIEISPDAKPPVAKIMDYGKFLYDEKKKEKVSRARSHKVEVKGLQVKLGTSDHDLSLKAKKASEWLKEGHRIKIDLFLPGRSKYLDQKFLSERLERILKLLTEDYKVTDTAKKSPKGMSTVIEKA